MPSRKMTHKKKQKVTKKTVLRKVKVNTKLAKRLQNHPYAHVIRDMYIRSKSLPHVPQNIPKGLFHFLDFIWVSNMPNDCYC